MIKIIAFVTMLLDHIGLVYFPGISLFRILGRLSFPLFAWGIANGYRKTNNIKAYGMRLLILGLLSQLPYYLLFHTGYLNICFTLLIGLLVIALYESSLSIGLKLMGLMIAIAFTYYIPFEYSFYGLLTILLFHIFWNKGSIIYYQGVLTIVAILVLKFDPMQLVSILSVLIVLVFQNHYIKLKKWIQYGFYPIHLVILLLLKIGGI